MAIEFSSGNARQNFAPQNFAGETIAKDINEVKRKKHTGNTIDNFKSKMTSFARPNLFEVTIYAKPDNVEKSLQERLRFSCFNAVIPGMTTMTTEKDEGYRSIAYQKAYEDVTLGFYVHGDMKELKVFQDWMKLMVRPEDNHVGFYDDYKSTIEIRNLDRQQKRVLTTTLYDAYPKALSPVSLDSSANDDIMKIDTTITYRYYTQQFGDKQEPVGQSIESAEHYENNMEEVDVDAVQINQALDKTTKIKKLGDSWKTWTKK